MLACRAACTSGRPRSPMPRWHTAVVTLVQLLVVMAEQAHPSAALHRGLRSGGGTGPRVAGGDSWVQYGSVPYARFGAAADSFPALNGIVAALTGGRGSDGELKSDLYVMFSEDGTSSAVPFAAALLLHCTRPVRPVP